jgi:hypothetical protein
MNTEWNISLNFGEEHCSHVKLLQYIKHIIIYCDVFATEDVKCNVFKYWDTQFGLLICFINHSQVVTTIIYNTVTDLHNYTPVSSVYLP